MVLLVKSFNLEPFIEYLKIDFIDLVAFYKTFYWWSFRFVNKNLPLGQINVKIVFFFNIPTRMLYIYTEVLCT